MPSRIKHDDILLLEQPILKVPTDALRSSLRSTQRVLEREFEKLNAQLKEAAGSPSQSSRDGEAEQILANQNGTLKVIDGLLQKARGLKGKLQDTYSNPQTGMEPSLARIKARIDHLQDLYSAEYTTDHTTRLDRHLVDYMLRSGYTNSARSLSQLAGIELLTDAPLFAELARIEKALSQHSCSEALAWCKENSAALKKMQSTLEFELRYQEFIELARAKRFHEAIRYSHKQLVPWQTTHLDEISKVMTLLAFDERTKCPPYAVNPLCLTFDTRATVFTPFTVGGTSVIKLPACYGNPTNRRTVEDIEMSNSTSLFQPSQGKAHVEDSGIIPGGALSNYDPTLMTGTNNMEEATPGKNPDCPVCDADGLGRLALECPWSHHVNSIIVCSLTGKVVNDGDGLAVLPNGRVYSRDGLELLADKDEGRICCPRTAQVFAINEIRRVFIS